MFNNAIKWVTENFSKGPCFSSRVVCKIGYFLIKQILDIPHFEVFLFYVGLPKEDIFIDHLPWSIFQSWEWDIEITSPLLFEQDGPILCVIIFVLFIMWKIQNYNTIVLTNNKYPKISKDTKILSKKRQNFATNAKIFTPSIWCWSKYTTIYIVVSWGPN